MPIYEYECDTCGTFEDIASVNAPPLRQCPQGHKRVRRVLSTNAIKIMKPFGPHISIPGYADSPVSSSGH